ETAILVLGLARAAARGLVIYNRRLHPGDTGAEQPAAVQPSRTNAAVELRQDTRRASARGTGSRRRKRRTSWTHRTFRRGERASLDARRRRLRARRPDPRRLS